MDSGNSDRRRIGRALARLFASRRRNGDRPLATPGCEFGLLVEERLRDLAEDFAELKALLRWLIYLVAGGIVAFVLEAVLRRML